jgi:integrase
MKRRRKRETPPRRPYKTLGVSMAITEALIAKAPELLAERGSPDELIVRDPDLKGFIVRLRASGRHTYAAAYGRGRALKLGSSDRLTAGKARKAAREALAETALQGAPVMAEKKAARLTLKRFLDDHYEPWAEEHLKTPGETLARIRGHFGALLETRIADVTAFSIERWRTARLKAGKQKSTINRDVVALKAALSKAVGWGLVKAHPIASVKPYRVDRQAVIRYLTADEETQLLSALGLRDDRRKESRASGNKWRQARGYAVLAEHHELPDHLTPLVIVALHTGLRRGELFSLKWDDVDLVRNLVTVRGSGAKSGNTRHVPLNDTAMTTLKKWNSRSKTDLKGLVFPGIEGEPLEDIKTAWGALVTAAAIKDFRFHDLRHTFASKLVQAGVDLNTVRELLGHGDIKMTLRYAHLAPESKAAAVAKLVVPR